MASDESLNKLQREERKRHEETLKILQQAHADRMERLHSNLFQRILGLIWRAWNWLHRIFCFCSRDDGLGTCFIIWNEPRGQNIGPGFVAQSFRRRGFTVQLKKNSSEEEIQKLLLKISTSPLEGSSTVFVFASKGTLEYIESADGKKMKLRDIIDSLSPERATSHIDAPKLFFFQCEAGDQPQGMWNYEEPPFAPKYDDALVLCSTHRNFLSTLANFLTTDSNDEFEEIMSKVVDELKPISTAQEGIGTVSTLQTKVRLS